MTQKIISTLLLITITSLILGGIFLPAKRVQATVPTIDAKNIVVTVAGFIAELAKKAWQVGMDNASRWAIKVADWLWQEALATLLAILKKKILDMLVNEIITWIQGGGEPKFITNWWDFLDQSVNEAEHKFSRQLSQSNVCDSFKSTLIKSFEPSGAYNGISGFVGDLDESFNQKINCTFEKEAGTSFENFFKDFRSGGWKGWLSITEPQNNFYGAFLMAQDEKLNLIGRAKEAAQNKGLANSGWLGDERCTVCSLYDEENNKIGSATGLKACEKLLEEINKEGQKEWEWQCDKREIFTPGDAVGELAAEAITSEMDWVKNITSSKELGAYLAAIASALINRIFDTGLSLVDPRGDGRSSYTSSNPEPPEEEVAVGNMGLSESSISLKTGESENIVVTILDANGEPMANATVTAKSSNPNVVMVTPASMTTDENGQAIFSVMAVSVPDTNTTINITFRAGSEERTATVTVTAPQQEDDGPGGPPPNPPPPT